MITLTFAIYLLVMLAIGLSAYRYNRDLNDYILGGRRLGPWTTALSAGASDMSAWLLLGLPGLAYASGLTSIWLAAGLLLGTYLNWRFIAKRLRVLTQRLDNTVTIPGYFARRFQDNSGALQSVCALFILLFFLIYTSSGLVAGGKLFESVFGLPFQYAVLTGAAAIISYTFIGGFLAVAWTDLVQGLLMCAALLLVPLITIEALGSWGEAQSVLEGQSPHFLNAWLASDGKPITAIAIISSLAWGLGYFGQPHILARFKAIRSGEEIGSARRIAVTWTAVTLVSACLVGLLGRAYLPDGVADSERIFILLVDALFHPVIAGILLAAILSAIMSTADSQLLVSSSALAEDLYKGLFNRQASEKALLWIGRFAVLVIALLATAIALRGNSGVLDLASYAWAGFGAAFGPAVILSLYWSRMTKWGAVAGIVAGGACVVVWKQLSGGLFDLYEIVPGFVFAVIAIVAVSLLSKPMTGIDLDSLDQ